MDKSDILERTTSERTLATESNYYRFIFKKTEKIVCAVFYILRSSTPSIRHDDAIVKDIEASAQKVMAIALTTLHTPIAQSARSADEMSYALIELESKLRILNAGQILSSDLLNVFLNEIDAVLRTLRNYSENHVSNPLFVEEAPKKRERERRTLGSASAALSTSSSPTTPSRRDRVMGVLKDKGQATIKDVSDVITDVSEKTIQIELNSLISEGVVHREGERRWSKYSLL